MNILLIEDHEDHAELVRFTLGSRHLVVRVERLSEATEALEKKDYDVVLCDLSLPDGSGVENVQRIRAVSPTVPLVVLTCLDDDDVAMQALEAGAQDYLVKSAVMMNRQTAELSLNRSILYAKQRQLAILQTERLVDELKESQRLLEEKNERLGELCSTAQRFVDTVSHEFRTPLTVIKEYSSLIREGVVGETNERQQEMLSVLEDRADDLNTMVDDMLDVSRLESGLLGVVRQEHTVQSIVDRVENALQRKAAVHEVDLTIHVADDLPTVWCDAEKAGRVLINLVVNAIKFSSEPGVVRVDVRYDTVSSDVVFAVNDNGPGIASDNMQVIFDRFTQPVTSVRLSTKGFGLGLAIAKELVDLNHGRMSVESEEGVGSTFSFSAPIAEPTEILKRHLDRFKKISPNSCAHLVTLTAYFADDPRDQRDLNLMIGQHLMTRDLLFPVGEGRWVAVLVTPLSEYELFTQRLEEKHAKVSRNRPKGPLPALAVERLTYCRVNECSAAGFTKNFAEAFALTPEVCGA